MRNSRNKKMIIVLGIFIILLLLIAIYLAYFQIFKSDFYASHDFNTRNNVDESQVLRGTIRDRDGNALTYTERDEAGNNVRINKYSYMYSPIIGYTSPNLGKTGLEAKYNRKLLNIPENYDVISQLEDMYSKSEKGQDIYLTIDNEIQEYLFDLMEGYTGAAVVINPKNGDVLAMVSRPTFNLNKYEEYWDSYINSQEAVLLNRATQGIYTPGSVFKIISSVALLENNVDLEYDDKGSTTIDGYTINNYLHQAHGPIGLREALMTSSNSYFSDKSKELNNEQYKKVLRDFMIGEDYSFDLPRSMARIPFNKKLTTLEKAVSAFGQGETLVTPLDMANVVSALANDGVLMKPRLVYKTSREGKETLLEEEKLSTALEPGINAKMVDYLISTAKDNNATLNNGVVLAGKSGTAEVGDTTNLWYTGFTHDEDKKYAIAVVVENTNSDNGHVAKQIFVKTMNYLYNR